MLKKLICLIIGHRFSCFVRIGETPYDQYKGYHKPLPYCPRCYAINKNFDEMMGKIEKDLFKEL